MAEPRARRFERRSFAVFDAHGQRGPGVEAVGLGALGISEGALRGLQTRPSEPNVFARGQTEESFPGATTNYKERISKRPVRL